jgi:RIO kinase 1
MREKRGARRRDGRQLQQSSDVERDSEGELPTAVAPGPLPSAAALAFANTVQVTEAERAWIRQHLLPFVENELIVDVIRRVKAGKEATVYLCSAHPSSGRSFIAAKLYRERSMRSSRNVGQYQQGRGLLDEEGQSEGRGSWRLDKAMTQASKRGQAATQTSWLMHEFTLLEALRAAGGDVPEPIDHGQQALLMEFIGDENDAAPTLNDVDLDPAEAQGLFERVMFNVELLLGMGWVHGDLSAYNILYQGGRIVLIDFPQVVDCRNNPRARAIFARDVERVAQYFAGAGWNVDHERLTSELWDKYVSDADASP